MDEAVRVDPRALTGFEPRGLRDEPRHDAVRVSRRDEGDVQPLLLQQSPVHLGHLRPHGTHLEPPSQVF